MWTIAEKAYKRKYHSNCCSTATYFCVFIYFLIFTVPFLLANFQKNLWRIDNSISDGGTLVFENKVIVVTSEKKSYSTLDQFKKDWSEDRYHAAEYESLLQTDSDTDINFRVKFYPTTSTGLTGHLYFFLNYQSPATGDFRLKFNNMLRIPFQLNNSALNKLTIVGEVTVSQKDIYTISDYTLGKYSIDAWKAFEDNSESLEIAYQTASKGNFSMKPKTRSYFSITSPRQAVEIEVRLRKKQWTISMTNNIAALLRNGWYLYLAFFIPVYYLLRMFMREVFRFQLFSPSITLEIGELELRAVY